MVLSLYAKQRILIYYSRGYQSSNKIRKLLAEEDHILVTRVTIWKFLWNYAKTSSLARKEGSGRPSKITSQVKAIVEHHMEMGDETTAYQLHKLLTDRGHVMTTSTVLRCCKELGWTFRG